MDRVEELKARLRNAPTIEATYAEIDAELAKLKPHYDALKSRHTALGCQMAQFASDRAELGLPVPEPENKAGESAPVSQPTDKPKTQGKKP